MEDIPYLKPGDALPMKASWWNRLIRSIKSLRLRVGTGGELELRNTPDGVVLNFVRYNCLKVGVTSGTITARSGSTAGSGSVVLRAFRPSTYTAAETVTAYWAGSATIAGSTYVLCGLVDGYWHILSVDCP